MPEEPEIEMPDAPEGRAQGLTRAIALTTALFAALAAVAALRAGGTVNEALLLKTEATQFQSQASDQWTQYQAKSIKAAIQAASAAAWRAAGKEPPATLAQEETRYEGEEKEIETAARKLEQSRDYKSAEADHLLHTHHHFADAVALFQIAIALGAIAALTRMSSIWLGSLALGLAGAVLFFATILA